MPKAKGPDGNELTREDLVDALLQRIAAYTVVLKRQLRDEDFKTLRTLRPFLKAADRLMEEIGYRDEQ
jgi:hypothetical protein